MPLHRYFSLPKTALLKERADIISGTSEMYMDHRFDLLGSGWLQVYHGMHCDGTEGHVYSAEHKPTSDALNAANRNISARLVAMLSTDYRKIDWQLDFKSGYRWSEATWYQDILYGHMPGVDIKVPWELARMQHLLTLVWAYALSGHGLAGFRPAQAYADEIVNQITDFIAHNPPRFGVNWRCTMDIAIRATNWLVAYDLLRAAGAPADDRFERLLIQSLLDHGRHIISNLEWDPDYRANHYLANVVGLLFIAAYLPRTEETDRWLAFSVQELTREVAHQFNTDGSGFEASTAYHRLSAEMAIYGTALVHALSEDKRAALGEKFQSFPNTHYDKLRKVAGFTAWVTKPSGDIAQIGDNDSGRFLKIAPAYDKCSVAEAKAMYLNLAAFNALRGDASYWSERHLDHRHLLGAADGLLGDEPTRDKTAEYQLEFDTVRQMIGTPIQTDTPAPGAEPRTLAPLPSLPFGTCFADIDIQLPGAEITANLRLAAFVDFGLYLFKSNRLFLALRCGSIGLNGRGAHAHNDQLTLELTVDGEDWISDPGSYLYTALAERRNQYRSVNAHFAPKPLDQEPGNLGLGLFWLGDEAQAHCDSFSQEGFLGHHHGFGTPVFRHVAVFANNIRIRDVIDAPATPTEPLVLSGREAVRSALQPAIPFSPGYGIQVINRR